MTTIYFKNWQDLRSVLSGLVLSAIVEQVGLVQGNFRNKFWHFKCLKLHLKWLFWHFKTKNLRFYKVFILQACRSFQRCTTLPLFCTIVKNEHFISKFVVEKNDLSHLTGNEMNWRKVNSSVDVYSRYLWNNLSTLFFFFNSWSQFNVEVRVSKKMIWEKMGAKKSWCGFKCPNHLSYINNICFVFKNFTLRFPKFIIKTNYKNVSVSDQLVQW